MQAEVFIPFERPGRPQVAREVRSTLIVSSIQALRTHGYYDAYVAQVGGRTQEMLSLIAGQWIPIEIGLEHYRAADRLRLDEGTIDRLGANVGE